MAHYKLALLGFGNVGKALARLLVRKRADIQSHYGITYRITGVATGRHGSAIQPDGLDIEKALSLSEAGASLDTLSTRPLADNFDFIRASQADVLFENSPVNYDSGQPAIDHLRCAMENGMHAVTANKGPVVYALRELNELASENGVHFYFESTVMDGAPIFSLQRATLPTARVLSLRGVLNSTTNLILTRMEEGDTFDQAVAHAQQLGIAETDPSGDVDGWDAAIKLAALATVVMGVPLTPGEVSREGIRRIGAAEMEAAREQEKRWKLVCRAERVPGGVRASVAPELVAADSPMYNLRGTTSIVQFETDVLGLLSIVEEDPGPDTTAYGLLADFLNAVRD